MFGLRESRGIVGERWCAMPRRRLEDATPAEIPRAQRIRWWLAVAGAFLVLVAVLYVPHLPAHSPLTPLFAARSSVSGTTS